MDRSGFKKQSEWFQSLIDAMDWSYENLGENVLDINYVKKDNRNLYRVEWIEPFVDLLFVDLIAKRISYYNWNRSKLREKTGMNPKTIDKLLKQGQIVDSSLKRLCLTLNLDYLQIKAFKDQNVRTGIAELNQS